MMEYVKRYLLLGASSDLGTGLLRNLNDKECDCLFMAHYRSDSAGIRNIEEKNGNIILPIKADLSVNEDVEKLGDEIQKYSEFPTHIVHFAAAKYNYTRLKKFNSEDLEREFQISVISFAEIMKRFLPMMVKTKDITKVVVMLSSVIYGKPPKNLMTYVMVKSALYGLVKSMASDFAEKGIKINGIAPSMIETKFLSQIDGKIPVINADNSIDKRNAKIEDIVPVIEFLLSGDSDYLNGEVIKVTNGNEM